jgi:hypothetical protein
MKTQEEIQEIVDNAINTAMAEIQSMIDPENLTDSGSHCEMYFEEKKNEMRRMKTILETYAKCLGMAVDETRS